uniref:exodeoxyribonuclease III n=1 Tax=Latimeria chalumnae TaxID=7897 RepID=H3AMF6_LATCH
ILFLSFSWINQYLKRKKLLIYLRHKKADVVFLQEKAPHPQSGMEAETFHSTHAEKTRGAAILLPKSSPLQVERQIRDQEGRILVLEVSLLGTRTALANIYAPNTSDPRFYASLEALSQEVQDLPLIIGGDFNQVIDPILDRSAHDREAIRGIMRDKELVEIWRLIHPQASDFTFKSGCHGTKSQIDFFFLSQSMVEQVSSCDIGIRALTDHAPVDLVIHWGDSQTARGRWHMNVSLVNNPAIREKLAAVIRDYLEINTGSVTSFSTLWEAGKAFLRGHVLKSLLGKRGRTRMPSK